MEYCGLGEMYIFLLDALTSKHVSGVADYAEISVFHLQTSCLGWNTDMTEFRTYFFLLMNEAISLKPRFISHEMNLNILCLSLT